MPETITFHRDQVLALADLIEVLVANLEAATRDDGSNEQTALVRNQALMFSQVNVELLRDIAGR